MYTPAVPSLTQNLRTLPRPAWILFAGTFVNRFGTFVMPFLAIYMTRLGYTPTQAGFAVSAYGAGHLGASFIGGHLADRIGRRHTIALSMLSSSGAMLALSQARALPVILLLAFVVGLVGELYRPAATALLGDLVQPEQRIAAFGMYRFAINLGFAAGPATAGFLAERSFFWVFFGDAVTSFVYGLVALFALPHGLRSSSKDEAPAEGLRHALSNRPFVLFLLATLCLTWIEFQLHSTLPLHITSIGYSTRAYGALMSINGVVIILFELALTAWTQRLPPKPLIALGYALTGVGFALTGFGTTMPVLVTSVLIWTLGEMIYAPVTGAYVTGLAPERYRGRYMGLWHTMWSSGMLLGPIMGTWIYERNRNALWLVCLALGGVAAVLSLMKGEPKAEPQSVSAT
ncbi:MAG TPA: MFS transporter [Thermoanaerobaculia bacterium]|nr:MFS transporter [Thermoanaerobaculia bacterium]